MRTCRRGLGRISCLMIMITVLILAGCSKESLFEPKTDDFRIISFTGEVLSHMDSEEFAYKQEIRWTNPNTNNAEYAIKFITTDEKLPEGFVSNDEGWIYFSGEGVPCSTEECEQKSIWHRKNSFSIVFLSEKQQLEQLISKFYVKYRSGGLVSEPISQNFRIGEIATRIYMPWGTENMPEYLWGRAGSGIKIGFQEVISDIFIQGLYAQEFKYRLNVIDQQTNEIISYGEWYSTIDSYDIREVRLNRYTEPALTVNDEGELTQLEAFVITRNGIEEEDRQTINFKVSEGFQPQARIYTQDILVLGQNHFTTYRNPVYTKTIPNKMTSEGVIYGFPFFIDSEGRFSAIYSPDMQINFSYGWKGQYNNDNPQGALLNEVYDVTTGWNYFSEIISVDVSLNNEPIPYQFYENHPDYPERYVIFDDNQTGWLRMPVNEHIHFIPSIRAEHLKIGENNLKVRVIDSQNVISETEEFTFFIKPSVQREDKENILVIHNETYPNPAFLSYTIGFYEDIATDLDLGRVDFINRRLVREQNTPYGHHQDRMFLSAAQFEPYKLVIWHSDNPTEIGPNNANVHNEYEVINIYLRGGGNMLISGGANIHSMKNAAENQVFRNNVFHNYFGLTYGSNEVTSILSGSFFGPSARPYFTGGTPDQNTPLAIGDIHINWEHPYLAVLQHSQDIEGLGPITYFNEEYFADTFTTPLYRMIATEEGSEFDGVTVAIRRVTNNNKTYVFGFPLSYMDKGQVTDMLNVILNEQ